MTLPSALLIAAALIALAAVVGVLLRRRDGRRTDARDGERVDPTHLSPATLGSGATLVQFSTEFCARCPQVRRLLGDLAAERPGVVHAEVDLTHRADLASRYRVLSTPTTLLVDPDGRILTRFTGVPSRPALLAALDDVAHLQEAS